MVEGFGLRWGASTFYGFQLLHYTIPLSPVPTPDCRQNLHNSQWSSALAKVGPEPNTTEKNPNIHFHPIPPPQMDKIEINSSA